MSKKAIVAAACAVSSLVVPASAGAWECLSELCPKQCEVPLTYVIGDIDESVDEAAAVVEIQRAVDAWNAPDCFDFQFEYLGRAAEAGGAPDIHIAWVDPWPSEYGPSGSTFGVSETTWMQSNGCMVSSGSPNVLLNGEWAWSTAGDADFVTAADVYTVVLSRMGALLGMGNGSQGASVVSSATNSVITTGILSEDEDAICYLYADGTNGPRTLATPPSYCAVCTVDGDCAAGSKCLDLGYAEAVCIPTCDAGETCPGDSDCVVSSEFGTVCLAGEFGLPRCPDTSGTPGVPDVGVSEPDMGTPDGGAGGEYDMEPRPYTPPEGLPDMGAGPSISGGQDGCTVASGPSATWPLLLIMGWVGTRRRKVRHAA